MRWKTARFTVSVLVCSAAYFTTNLVLHLLARRYGWSLWGRPFDPGERAVAAMVFGLCFGAINSLRAMRRRVDEPGQEL